MSRYKYEVLVSLKKIFLNMNAPPINSSISFGLRIASGKLEKTNSLKFFFLSSNKDKKKLYIKKLV